jgi:hypothetical protein
MTRFAGCSANDSFDASKRSLTNGGKGSILLKVRQAKPGGVGSHVKENTTENF